MTGSLSAQPMATIVIPSYNDAADLVGALDRARAQTLDNIEIIVVDDCSSVPAEPTIRPVLIADARVKLIRRDANGGVFAALNTGIEQARGRYIYLGSTNDPIKPEFLKIAVDALERSAVAGMAFFDPGSVAGHPDRYQQFPLHLADKITCFTPDNFAERLRQRPFHLSSNTVVFRADALRSVGGCRREFELYADWFACVVTALRRGAVYVPRVLAYSRIHDDAFSNPSRWSAKTRSQYAAAALRAIAVEFPEIGPRLRHSLIVSEFGLCVLLTLREDVSIRPLVGFDGVAMASLRDAWGLLRKIMPDEGRRLIRKIAMTGRKAA